MDKPLIPVAGGCADPAVPGADSGRTRAGLGWQPASETHDAIVRTAWEWHRREAG